jgi:DNA-directed RNA polymerase specialized sigma24 family protein
VGTDTEATTTVTIVDPATARRLRAIAAKLDALDKERAALILRAHRKGASLREIGEAAGLSHVGVKKLIERHQR